MLERLSLRHFVFAHQLEIEFAPGFCVLTGETGTGKSLLVGTLSLLMGAAPAASLLSADDNAEVEAAFDIADNSLIADWLASRDLAADEGMLLARRVFAAGSRRSTAYLNGRQVPLAQLAEAVGLLMDICGQHAHYSLKNAAAQRDLLDAFAKADRRTVGRCYGDYRAAEAAWREMQGRQESMATERRHLTEDLEELRILDFSEEKWTRMNAALTRTTHIADLAAACTGAMRRLEGDGGAIPLAAASERELRALGNHEPKLAQVADLLGDATALLNDAARDINACAESLSVNPDEQEVAEAFVADCHRLARKHDLSSPALLGGLVADKRAALEALPASDAAALLEREMTEKGRALQAACCVLSGQRRKAAEKLNRKVNALLKKLAMGRANFSVVLTTTESPTSTGGEKVEFHLRTRDDAPAGTIAEIASGGELSRLGLAIQMAAGSGRDGTVSVFDEVDNGIGGAPADEVGRLLKKLGAARQVICVTHLPQVAAHADAHWRVVGGSELRVEALAADDRVEELARMQSGATVTDTARRHAKELIEGGGSR